jgi:integrase
VTKTNKEKEMNSNTKSTRYRSFGSIRKNGKNKFLPYYTHNGQLYYGTQTFTKTEAENWLAQEKLLIAKRKWSTPGVPDPRNTLPPRFGEYALRHIELQTNSNGEHLKPTTRARYRSYLDGWLADLVDLRVDGITKPMVDQFWSQWLSTGKKTTASRHYKFLKSVMSRAVTEGWLGENGVNPCQVKGAQNASSRRPVKTPVLSEVGALANAINPRFRTLVILCGYVGLRFGEVSALQVGDFRKVEDGDESHYIVSVKRAVNLVDGEFIVGTTKSLNGVRDLVVPVKLTSLLDEHLRSLGSTPDDTLVFQSSKGTFIRNDVLNKAMREAAARAGLDPNGFSPHALRRAAATEYANRGANVAEVQALLGDASPDAALRYIQPTNRAHQLINLMGQDLEI